MKYKFYKIAWKHEGEKTDEPYPCYYYTSEGFYSIDDMKVTVKKLFSLNPSAVVVISNIEEISQEQFELATKKPFKL